MSSTVAIPSTFTDLPTTMFERIAENTDRKNLKSLRLVSRDCAAEVLKIYEEFLFTDLTVMLYTEYSLRRAIAVIRYPALGSFVHMLIVVNDVIMHPEIRLLEEPCESVSQPRRLQEQFREKEEDYRLLTQLLGKCQARSKVSILYFRCFDKEADGPRTGTRASPSDDHCFHLASTALPH